MRRRASTNPGTVPRGFCINIIGKSRSAIGNALNNNAHNVLNAFKRTVINIQGNDWIASKREILNG